MKLLHLSPILLGLSASYVAAFPRFRNDGRGALAEHSTEPGKCPYSLTNKVEKRQAAFDPSSQYISTTGAHAFVAPDFPAGDQRGPCPGLNALANHGYLPHSGVASLTTITEAVNTGEFCPSQPRTHHR